MMENIRLALEAIRANKMRAFLTMLGIIIGIGSVISIVSIGSSMRAMVADQYKNVGLNRAMVYVSYEYSDDYRLSDYFTLDDIETLYENFPDKIAYMDPSSYATTDVINNRKTVKTDLQGIGPKYTNVQTVNIISGRMINEADLESRKKHMVLEEKTAIRLFGTANVVGKTVRATIRNELDDYLIVGVYREEVTAFSALMGGLNQNGTGFVPYTVITYPDDYFFSINLYAADDIDVESFRNEFIKYEAKVKNRPESAIVYYSVMEEMGMMDQMMSGLSLAVGAIAAISLLVGGIGIMNIMMVSVTERTREIGIRKALGARTKDVMVQFLTESAIISAAGGIIGILLAIGLVTLGGSLLGMPVVIQPGVVLLAVCFSALVGIFFGMYPASKAAKADPIIALRYE